MRLRTAAPLVSWFAAATAWMVGSWIDPARRAMTRIGFLVVPPVTGHPLLFRVARNAARHSTPYRDLARAGFRFWFLTRSSPFHHCAVRLRVRGAAYLFCTYTLAARAFCDAICAHAATTFASYGSHAWHRFNTLWFGLTHILTRQLLHSFRFLGCGAPLLPYTVRVCAGCCAGRGCRGTLMVCADKHALSPRNARLCYMPLRAHFCSRASHGSPPHWFAGISLQQRTRRVRLHRVAHHSTISRALRSLHFLAASCKRPRAQTRTRLFPRLRASSLSYASHTQFSLPAYARAARYARSFSRVGSLTASTTNRARRHWFAVLLVLFYAFSGHSPTP